MYDFFTPILSWMKLNFMVNPSGRIPVRWLDNIYIYLNYILTIP